MSSRSISLPVAGSVFAAGPLLAADAHLGLDDVIAEALAAGPGLQALGSSAEAAQREATARDKRLFEARAISQEQWDRSRATDAAPPSVVRSRRAMS